MATVTPVLNKRYAAKDGYPINVRITSGNKHKSRSIGYCVQDDQWDGRQVVKHPDAELINGVLWEKLDQANRYIADCAVRRRPIDLELAGTNRTSHSFIDYLQHREDQYRAKGQIIMRRKLARCVKELKDCFKREALFDEINNDLLVTFDSWLIKKRELR